MDDMVVKRSLGENHYAGLEDILESVRRYNLCLNPQNALLVYMWNFFGIYVN